MASNKIIWQSIKVQRASASELFSGFQCAAERVVTRSVRCHGNRTLQHASRVPDSVAPSMLYIGRTVLATWMMTCFD